MNSCDHNGGMTIPQSVLDDLPDCQGGDGRHKCVVCAYNAGLTDPLKVKELSATSCKHGALVPHETFVNLPDAQSGDGRHKCAFRAYHAGREHAYAKIV